MTGPLGRLKARLAPGLRSPPNAVRSHEADHVNLRRAVDGALNLVDSGASKVGGCRQSRRYGVTAFS